MSSRYRAAMPSVGRIVAGDVVGEGAAHVVAARYSDTLAHAAAMSPAPGCYASGA